MQEYAIIVAGGKGTRINSDVPKQFIELQGRPIILHTLDAFYRYSQKLIVVLVLPADDFPLWESLCKKFDFRGPVILQKGGASRFESVRNGLDKIEGNGLVAIHDAVRPLVSTDLIGASFRLAAIHHCAVAAVRLKESIRMTDKAGTKAMDRSQFRLIQTPQTFDVHLIREAYRMKEDIGFTDDAIVAEKAGHTISLFEGSFENIKITTAEDLVIAEALLKQKSRPEVSF